MTTTIIRQARDETLQRYGIMPPGGGSRPFHGGCEVTLTGRKRDDGRKLLTVTIGGVSESRLCPFGSKDSYEIVQRVCERSSQALLPVLERSLEPLITKVAQMYVTEPIEAFSLERVHVHADGYSIGAVLITP